MAFYTNLQIQSPSGPYTNDISGLTTIGSWGRIKIRKVGNRLYVKEWADGDAEPDWRLDREISEDDIDPDDLHFTISGQVGNNGGTAQKVEVDWVKVSTVAASGATVASDFVAYGDSTTTKFFIAPFRAGSLIVTVDTFATVPVEQNAEQGWFRLDRAPYGDPSDPTGCSVISATYEKA